MPAFPFSIPNSSTRICYMLGFLEIFHVPKKMTYHSPRPKKGKLRKCLLGGGYKTGLSHTEYGPCSFPYLLTHLDSFAKISRLKLGEEP